ncbi:hypothetical protein CANARDRAFT_204271, partial [[Candida] arabinofermentans NRRL YB-2248]
TVSYSSFQNGMAEWMHRTVQEKARVLLMPTELPEQFWPEAVVTADLLSIVLYHLSLTF